MRVNYDEFLSDLKQYIKDFAEKLKDNKNKKIILKQMTITMSMVLRTIKRYNELPYIIAVDSEYWDSHIIGYRGDIHQYDKGFFAYIDNTDDYDTICKKQQFTGFYVHFINVHKLKDKYGVDFMPINSYEYSSMFNIFTIKEEFNIDTMETSKNTISIF
jgi:hypothetical protein